MTDFLRTQRMLALSGGKNAHCLLDTVLSLSSNSSLTQQVITEHLLCAGAPTKSWRRNIYVCIYIYLSYIYMSYKRAHTHTHTPLLVLSTLFENFYTSVFEQK